MRQTLHPARRPGEPSTLRIAHHRAHKLARVTTRIPRYTVQSIHLGTPQHFLGGLIVTKLPGLIL
jgi:hypothetical protein